IRAWEKSGLIHAVETVHGISHFDYRQVVSAKTLCDLVQAGVKPARLRRSIRQLQRWLINLEQPILQLAILERDGALLFRLENGLAEPRGQRCFDFADPVDQATLSLSQWPATADQWFERGCEHADAERFDDAVKAYRQALRMGGPNPTLCFHLANALYALGEKGPARERFYQAVELKAEFGEAWNNLGTVRAELGTEGGGADRVPQGAGIGTRLRRCALQRGRSPGRHGPSFGSLPPLAGLRPTRRAQRLGSPRT